MRPFPYRLAWRLVILALGGLQTAIAGLEQSMGADGLNYLTIGSAFWSGDWQSAINGVWSPLYGILAAAPLALFDPGVSWVFPTVQIVNFAIFAVSLVCFERLWSELWTASRERERSDGRVLPLPAWLWWSVGYALFLWAGLNLIQIWAVTPDMLVAAAVYLSASLLVRVARGKRPPTTYAALGATLGFGYLAKAPMFPLGLVALVLAGVLHDRLREAVRGVSMAGAVFAVVAGPFLVALSLDQGRPTFSEVSRFTYLKHVNRIPYPHWRPGVVEGIGVPAHPPRRVHEAPDVYVYTGPVGGSYPASFDPDYWTEGLRPRVDAFQQLNEIANSLSFYFGLFFREQGPFLGVFALLALLAAAGGARPPLRNGDWALSIWALVCFAMYSLVFVTERYVAPFVVLFWAGLLSYGRIRPSDAARKISLAGGVLLVAATLTNVVAMNFAGLGGLVGFRPPIEARAGQFQDGAWAPPDRIASEVQRFGVGAGADVAFIGYSFTALWAHLAHVRIVAEIWPEQAALFWRTEAAEREEVFARFREAGARFVVAEVGPTDAGVEDGWATLGETGYLIRTLE